MLMGVVYTNLEGICLPNLYSELLKCKQNLPIIMFVECYAILSNPIPPNKMCACPILFTILKRYFYTWYHNSNTIL